MGAKVTSQTQSSTKVLSPFTSWYCEQCQRAVEPKEVGYNEQHAACGRCISDDRAPEERLPAIAAAPTLTIDLQDILQLRYAAQREDGRAALRELGRLTSTSDALRFGCIWGCAALEDVIADRVDTIRRRGCLLHYGAPGVAA
jgi:hypothetical protein